MNISHTKKISEFVRNTSVPFYRMSLVLIFENGLALLLVRLTLLNSSLRNKERSRLILVTSSSTFHETMVCVPHCTFNSIKKPEFLRELRMPAAKCNRLDRSLISRPFSGQWLARFRLRLRRDRGRTSDVCRNQAINPTERAIQKA